MMNQPTPPKIATVVFAGNPRVAEMALHAIRTQAETINAGTAVPVKWRSSENRPSNAYDADALSIRGKAPTVLVLAAPRDGTMPQGWVSAAKEQKHVAVVGIARHDEHALQDFFKEKNIPFATYEANDFREKMTAAMTQALGLASERSSRVLSPRKVFRAAVVATKRSAAKEATKAEAAGRLAQAIAETARAMAARQESSVAIAQARVPGQPKPTPRRAEEAVPA